MTSTDRSQAGAPVLELRAPSGRVILRIERAGARCRRETEIIELNAVLDDVAYSLGLRSRPSATTESSDEQIAPVDRPEVAEVRSHSDTSQASENGCHLPDLKRR